LKYIFNHILLIEIDNEEEFEVEEIFNSWVFYENLE
jgi:hypothetical protein